MVLRLLERNRTCFVFVSEDQPFGSSCKFHEITPWDIYIFDIWCKYMWHARQKYAVDLAELSQIARCVRPPDESITGFVFRRIYHRFCRLFNRPQRWDGKFWSTVLSVCLCHLAKQPDHHCHTLTDAVSALAVKRSTLWGTVKNAKVLGFAEAVTKEF